MLTINYIRNLFSPQPFKKLESLQPPAELANFTAANLDYGPVITLTISFIPLRPISTAYVKAQQYSVHLQYGRVVRFWNVIFINIYTRQ